MPFRLLALAAACLLLIAGAASATTVLKLAPGEVDALADRIFEGRCTQIRSGPTDGGLPPSTEFVFTVERVVKGALQDGATLIVRQVGGPAAPPDRQIIGLPAYEVGRRYRLALNADSVLGLTSPVGLGQGVQALGEEPIRPTSGGAGRP